MVVYMGVWVCVGRKEYMGGGMIPKKEFLTTTNYFDCFAAFCFLVLNWLRREGKAKRIKKIKFRRRSLKSPSLPFALCK